MFMLYLSLLKVCITGTPYYWGGWSGWGTCTGCGIGSQAQTRTCMGTCGTQCVGPTTITQACASGEKASLPFLFFELICRVGTPLYWGSWSAWGACTGCGVGTQSQSRNCLGTCGPTCVGPSMSTQTCSVGKMNQWRSCGRIHSLFP